MSGKKKLAVVFWLAAGALGAVAARSETARRGAERATADARVAVEQSKGRLDAERHRLESRVLAAAQTKPLLAALGDNVDRTTLVDLFQSEDWWKDVRAEFPLTRLVVGPEVMATFGTPDPGTKDREVVLEARKNPVSSAVVTLGEQPFFLLASKLAIMPDRSPVLVLGKPVDHRFTDAVVLPPPVPSRSSTDLGIALGAVVLLLAGGVLFVVARPAPVAQDIERTHTREDTIKFGVTAQKQAPPEGAPAATAPARASQPRSAVMSAHSVSVTSHAPAPVAVASTPAPAGPPRRPTVPGGVPVSETGPPGQVFGRYHLLDRLGQGGMADVFTAVAHGVEGFSRVFVLKRLRPELATDKEAIAQFVDEARMQSSLVHSNIVPVFDFGRVGNEYFMTQEYIVGRDLVRLIARCYEHSQQTITPRLAYYIVHETLQALQYAHSKRDKQGAHLGIVHRDVSAGNIIVSAQGEVKLADFGIVKSNARTSRTQMGMVKGNANFMSPEQARGQQVDSRSDLFSIATVLYYCLTNRLLYDGDNDLDVLYKAASGPTVEDFDRIRRLSSPASDVLGRALAPDPADRFQSAIEFADVLAPHIGGAKAEAARVMQTLFGDELRKEAA